MTAASDILRKPACISRQEAPSLMEGAGTCRTEDGEAARLDVGIRGGVVGYWHLYTGEEAADGE